MSKIIGVLVILFLLFLWAGNAQADCLVSATSINFGNYDVFSPTPLDSTGTISVTCTTNRNYQVEITIGPSPNSGSFDPRQMNLVTGTDLLNYNLYTDATYTTIWGDGTGGTGIVTIRVRNTTRDTTVYGRIPPGQDVSVGSYSEMLTVTIIN